MNRKRFLTLSALYLALCAISTQLTFSAGDLNTTLTNIDKGTKRFKGATADVKITRVGTPEAEDQEQQGKVYLLSDGKLRLDLTEPAERTILCLPDGVYHYKPSEALVERYKTSRWPRKIEQYMLLGFSTRGSQLKQDYILTVLSEETLDDNKVVLLELTPKQEAARALVSKIHLWISQSTWLPIQQRAFQGGPDSFVEVRYTQFASNVNISNDKFKTKWPKGTKTVNR